MLNSFQAIILAAGRSRRFNALHSKLRSRICGQEIIMYPVQICEQLGLPIACVVGHQKEELKELLIQKEIKNITFVEQLSAKGTGHALLCTQHMWRSDSILIMNGDMPLVTTALIQDMLSKHFETNAVVTFAVAQSPQPGMYGRVFSKNGQISIKEARECTADELKQTCINAGIYIMQRTFLQHYIYQLPLRTNGEYYLTDLIEYANQAKGHIQMVEVPFSSIQGVNTLEELSCAQALKRQEIIRYWMAQGVHFLMPETNHVDIDVTIGPRTTIGAGVILSQGTHIGKDCTIEPYTTITNSIIHDEATILSHCVITDSEIHFKSQIGPFAHIRNQTSIHEKSVIGNFVEVNKSVIAAESKAKHLSYLGNALIGKKVTIGAGTITCNYNGFTKSTTTIQDNAFIGSNTSLIAPVIIGNDSIVAAGSTITQSVPAHAVAFARARQINKLAYATQLKEKLKSEETVIVQPATQPHDKL